jgi:uncharacterized protein (TIGR02217 family)
MSQLIFPPLPGLTWPVTRQIIAPPVTIKQTPSQREFRFRSSRFVRTKLTLVFEFLMVSQAKQEYQTLRGFFNRVGGSFDDWLFEDLEDRHVSNELFAIGDGQTASFQLARSLGNFMEPVYGPNGAPVITANGVVVAPQSVSPTGVVTFAAPPANGVQLRWTGDFFLRARFTSDTLDLVKNYSTFYEAKKVELITVIPQ